MSALLSATWATERCCNCGVAFAITRELYELRRADHDTFYCPNGHGQHYTGETPDQRRAREAEAKAKSAQAALEWAQRERDWARTEAKGKAILLGKEKAKRARLEARAAHGVCPCCSRTFASLARHMASKHPDWQQRKRPTKRRGAR